MKQKKSRGAINRVKSETQYSRQLIEIRVNEAYHYPIELIGWQSGGTNGRHVPESSSSNGIPHAERIDFLDLQPRLELEVGEVPLGLEL